MLPTRRRLTVPEALTRQRRLLVFGAVILVWQLVNTVILWRARGEFPIWGGIAFLGVWVFFVMLLRQHRRLRALAQAQAAASAGPQRKRRRKRLRDPHRKQTND